MSNDVISVTPFDVSRNVDGDDWHVSDSCHIWPFPYVDWPGPELARIWNHNGSTSVPLRSYPVPLRSHAGSSPVPPGHTPITLRFHPVPHGHTSVPVRFHPVTLRFRAVPPGSSQSHFGSTRFHFGHNSVPFGSTSPHPVPLRPWSCKKRKEKIFLP